MKARVRTRTGGAEYVAEFDVPQRADLWKAVADRYGGQAGVCVLLVEVHVGRGRWEREEVAAGSFQVGCKAVTFVDSYGRVSGTPVIDTRDQGVAVNWARVYCPPGQRWVICEATVDSGEQGRVVDPAAGGAL